MHVQVISSWVHRYSADTLLDMPCQNVRSVPQEVASLIVPLLPLYASWPCPKLRTCAKWVCIVMTVAYDADTVGASSQRSGPVAVLLVNAVMPMYHSR